jgi:phosphohistidine phosphatase
MALYLVQHGKATPKDQDPLKQLSKEGIETTEMMAELAKVKNIQVSEIIHSGKKRAMQTAEIFSKYLNSDLKISERKGLDPKDDPEIFSKDLNINSDIMIVGHLPFLEKLAAYLITGNSENKLVKFQNSCIINIDSDENNDCYIKWTLMPFVN